MSDIGVELSALPAAAPLDGTETFPVVQGGVTKRTTGLAPASHLTDAAAHTGTFEQGGTGIIYVASGGSDANSGLMASSPKLTLSAAITALGSSVGKVVFMGTLAIDQAESTAITNAALGKTGLTIAGIGTRSRIRNLGTVTEMLRLVNTSQLTLEDFMIEPFPGGTITKGLHITTTGSTQGVTVKNVYVIGAAGTMTDGICVGADTNLDVSEVRFFGCWASYATNAAWKIGNGTVGNVTNIFMFGCVGRQSAYGVSAAGATFQWYGGTLQTNSVLDVSQGLAHGTSLKLVGVRSENSARFIESATISGGSVSLEDITIVGNTNRVVCDHAGNSTVVYKNVKIYGGAANSYINLGPNIVAFTGTDVWTNYANIIVNASSPDSALPRIFLVNCGRLDSAGVPIVASPNVNTVPSDRQVKVAFSATPVFDSTGGNTFAIVLTGNVTSSTIANAITPGGTPYGQQLTIAFVQDATGGRTYAWPANCRFAGNAPPAASTVANREDSVTFRYDGSLWREIARSVGVPAV